MKGAWDRGHIQKVLAPYRTSFTQTLIFSSNQSLPFFSPACAPRESLVHLLPVLHLCFLDPSDRGQEEKGWQRMRCLDGITDSNGHKFEQASGGGEGQGSLVCCSPWGHKESDTTERLNSNNKLPWSLRHILPPDLSGQISQLCTNLTFFMPVSRLLEKKIPRGWLLQ